MIHLEAANSLTFKECEMQVGQKHGETFKGNRRVVIILKCIEISDHYVVQLELNSVVGQLYFN